MTTIAIAMAQPMGPVRKAFAKSLPTHPAVTTSNPINAITPIAIRMGIDVPFNDMR
jgi:hypothetical protein